MATELETQLLGQVSASDKKVAALTAEVAEIRAQQNKLDPDEATHADLVTKVNELSGELSTVKRDHANSLADLETEQTARKDAETNASEANAKVDETEKDTQAAQVTENGKTVVDDLLKDFDNQYGAEHHNPAFAAAQAAWEKHDASKVDENGKFIVSDENRLVIIKSIIETEYVKLRDAKVASNAKGIEEPSLSAPSTSGNAEVAAKTALDLPDEKFKTRREAVTTLQEQFKREEAAAT